MYTFAELQQIINKNINDNILQQEMQPAELYAPIKYALSNGGKRIRPILALMAANLFTEDIEKWAMPVIGIETFHNFTLLHDDIMDNAAVRRGKQTVHLKWNANTAILSGDAMMIKAYEYISLCGKSLFFDVFNTVNRCSLDVCEGQQYDMNFESRNDVTIDEYLKMIGLKTASLLATSVKAGAILAGASDENCKRLAQFGYNLGMAFQLQDDYLDVFGDPKIFGKSIGGDIVANKKTYLLLCAYEQAEKNGIKAELEKLMCAKDNSEKEKIEKVRNLYLKLNVKELSEKKMYEFHHQALETLEKVNVEAEKKSELTKLANKLIKRMK